MTTASLKMIHCGPFGGKSFSFFQHIKGMLEAAASLTPLDPANGRKHERTHMFVAAVLNTCSGSCPVQIRNMSRGGALIEGAVLPPDDLAVRLRRGSLEISGRVVWQAGRKAGLAFDGSVAVADWMARNQPSHQARVDDIMQQIRKEGSRPSPVQSIPVARAPDTLVEEELRGLLQELARLEEGLTSDIVLVATHPEIQLLDIARQRVERLLAGLQARR